MAKTVDASQIIMKRFGRSVEPPGKEFLTKKPEYVVPTGSLILNSQLEFGGIPQSSVVEVFGWEGSGKSLSMYLAIAQSQKRYPDKPCAIIDAENQFRFQASWAERAGVDLNKLVLIPCSITEEIADIIYYMIVGKGKFSEKRGTSSKLLEIVEPGNYGIIGIDSVSKMVPKDSSEKGSDEKKRRGAKAAAISDLLDKIQGVMTRSDCNSKTILYFINQLRKNPNSGMFENPEYRTGGNSLKFANTIALQAKRVPKSEEYDAQNNITSHLMRVKFVKNKCGGCPDGWADLRIRYDQQGVDNYEELIDIGILNDVLSENGKKIIVNIPEFSDFKFLRSDCNDVLKKNKELKSKLLELFKTGKVFDVKKKSFGKITSDDNEDNSNDDEDVSGDFVSSEN
ncbi:MAG: hypothetical protein WC934_11830 [Acidithiobacillus sp.]|jgi:RecA/RadA recombinase|uniref:hypothetical protein n=1 Tax=Acidithiobacillus sp. TaxID=1872118 RepID=UPI00355CCD41